MSGDKARHSPIEKLDASHQVDSFDCGSPDLDDFLGSHAMANQKAGGATTYVLCRGRQRVIGFYSLAVGSVEHKDAPPRVGKGLARHPIPVMLLARLAVDRPEQGRRIGEALLKDAQQRTIDAAEIAGIRALLVQAKDANARGWYGRFDFEASPVRPNDLFLVMKDLKALARKQPKTRPGG